MVFFPKKRKNFEGSSTKVKLIFYRIYFAEESLNIENRNWKSLGDGKIYKIDIFYNVK